MCDTVVLIPLSFCAFNVSCLFNGLIYYNQWDELRWWQLVCVMIGVSLTVCGVLCLTWRRSGNAANIQEETVLEHEGYGAIPTSDDRRALFSNDDHHRADPVETTPLIA